MRLRAKRINHITISMPAGQHAQARAFYGVVLGLKEIPRPDALNSVYDLIWYEFLDILFHLDFTPPWHIPAENRHVAIEVEGLSSLRLYFQSQGAEIREAVVMPDRDRFYLLDPFGNYFELMEMKSAAAVEG
jgi:catechol 2,3-dioxygenase-like lactoylglutathione lyase family enzyme